MAGEKTEAAAAAETTAAAVDENFVTLRDPVKFGDETVTRLEWRKPTGADIIACGHPLRIDFSSDPPSITLDEKKMAAMMSVLYRQPPSFIARLGPNDWTTAAWAIAGFFTPDWTRI